MASSNITIDQLDDCIRALAERDLEQATTLAELNCQVAECRGDDVERGNCNSTLGWLYLQQDKLERALRYYQKALNVFERMPGAEEVVGKIRIDIGQIYEHQGKFGAAIDEYNKVLELAAAIDRRQKALGLVQERAHLELESDARNGLGRIHLAQERADDALAAFESALEISQKHDDRRGKETALGSLGQANHFLGRLSKATEYYREAIDISREINHESGTGRLLSSLGNVLLEQGKLSEAETHLEEALEIARRRHDRRGEQQRLGNLGNLYQALAKRGTNQGQSTTWLKKAEDHHREALSIARERDDRRSQGDHLTNLGNVYNKLERFEAARECYEEALCLAEGQDAADTQWRVHYAWGNLCAAQRQETEAFHYYENAIGIVECQRDRLKIESRKQFWQERAALYKRMVLCCLRLARLWLALEYTERAKARYLADLLAQRTPPTGNVQETIQAALKALPPRTAVAVFNVTEAGTVVFVVTDQPWESKGNSPDNGWQQSSDGRIRARLIKKFDRDTLQHILVEVDSSGKAVGGYLVDYYADIDGWTKSTLEPVSTDIYESLLAPVHQELIRLQVERVVFMPNLGLSLLPLHACYKANSMARDCLLDHYEITYAPSFDVLHRCQVQAQSKLRDGFNLLVVANPTRDLSGAGAEAKYISRLFQKHRVLGSDEKNQATVDTILTEAPDYAFVHFACHGTFNLREPLHSALLLRSIPPGWPADEPPPESFTLRIALTHLTLPRTRLVVMSACETGLVDPGDLADEYVSLPAGFLQAGVPAVISSLWIVDDIPTALLMERFYREYLGKHSHPGQALRAAQQWLRKEVDRPFVSRYIQSLLSDLEARHAQMPPFSEEAWSIAEEIKHLRQRREDLLEQEKQDPQGRPFDHLYDWAAFTISGCSP
jgi:CHAT domain-containing protein/tetratricopeptide (TPR) repeat protein